MTSRWSFFAFLIRARLAAARKGQRHCSWMVKNPEMLHLNSSAHFRLSNLVRRWGYHTQDQQLEYNTLGGGRSGFGPRPETQFRTRVVLSAFASPVRHSPPSVMHCCGNGLGQS